MNLLAQLLAHPFVFALIKKFAMRDVFGHLTGKDGTVYMRRWAILRERSWLPFSIRLHQIMRADQDRHLHDHPFAYRTFILAGHYTEETAQVVEGVRMPKFQWLCRGMTKVAPLGHFHRISHVSEYGVWTLFVMSRNIGAWGFNVNGQWVNRKDYFA